MFLPILGLRPMDFSLCVYIYTCTCRLYASYPHLYIYQSAAAYLRDLMCVQCVYSTCALAQPAFQSCHSYNMLPTALHWSVDHTQHPSTAHCLIISGWARPCSYMYRGVSRIQRGGGFTFTSIEYILPYNGYSHISVCRFFASCSSEDFSWL